VTPGEPGGTRSYYLARELIERGHDVVVVTSNLTNDDWPIVTTRVIDGIKVVYIKNKYHPSFGKIARIYFFLKFVLWSTVFAFREKGVDLVYASSTPITIGIPALLLKWIGRKPFILELRDLWPDVPHEMGYLNNRLLYRFTKLFEKRLYAAAVAIITISEGIRDRVGDSFQHKTESFPFGANTQMFSAVKNAEWKERNNITAPVLYLFTGAIGNANDLDYLVDAAEVLSRSDCVPAHIAIVGDGSARARLEDRLAREALSNVSLHPAVPVDELAEIYAAADAGIILFGQSSETYRYTASPNKFFDYIAAGLPVLFNFEGPLKAEIERRGFGRYASSFNSAEMAGLFEHYSDKPQELAAMGKVARSYAETEVDRRDILSRLANRIEAVGAEGGLT